MRTDFIQDLHSKFLNFSSIPISVWGSSHSTQTKICDFFDPSLPVDSLFSEAYLLVQTFGKPLPPYPLSTQIVKAHLLLNYIIGFTGAVELDGHLPTQFLEKKQKIYNCSNFQSNKMKHFIVVSILVTVGHMTNYTWIGPAVIVNLIKILFCKLFLLQLVM